jgi:two-component system, OmpR family, response regulator
MFAYSSPVQPACATMWVMRVLVVEDEPRLAEGLRAGLVAEGFAVDVALTGTDGLWLAREEPFDAIVLDLMLPGLNGYRVCQALRDEGNWTPILVLTAKDGEWDEVEGLDTGADDYLTKPFSYAVLVARLRALLRRGARERPAVLSAGDLRLDPAARRAWRGEVELVLTARELSLLEFLLRRRGEVVSKREILGHVWDFDFDGDPNIVEVYVRRLRDKLDRPFGRTAIETLRGAGYRLAGDGG